MMFAGGQLGFNPIIKVGSGNKLVWHILAQTDHRQNLTTKTWHIDIWCTNEPLYHWPLISARTINIHPPIIFHLDVTLYYKGLVLGVRYIFIFRNINFRSSSVRSSLQSSAAQELPSSWSPRWFAWRPSPNCSPTLWPGSASMEHSGCTQQFSSAVFSLDILLCRNMLESASCKLRKILIRNNGWRPSETGITK